MHLMDIKFMNKTIAGFDTVLGSFLIEGGCFLCEFYVFFHGDVHFLLSCDPRPELVLV